MKIVNQTKPKTEPYDIYLELLILIHSLGTFGQSGKNTHNGTTTHTVQCPCPQDILTDLIYCLSKSRHTVSWATSSPVGLVGLLGVHVMDICQGRPGYQTLFWGLGIPAAGAFSIALPDSSSDLHPVRPYHVYCLLNCTRFLIIIC